MVAVDAQGERTFLHYPGANAAFTAADVDWALIEAAHILHIAGPFLMPRFMGEDCAAVLRRAKELGKTTTLDTVWDATGRWMSVLEPSLPYLDYLLPSLEEARRLTGRDAPCDIAQVFLDQGVGVGRPQTGRAGLLPPHGRGRRVHRPRLPGPGRGRPGRGRRLGGRLPLRPHARLGPGADGPLRQRRRRLRRPGPRRDHRHPLL